VNRSRRDPFGHLDRLVANEHFVILNLHEFLPARLQPALNPSHVAQIFEQHFDDPRDIGFLLEALPSGLRRRRVKPHFMPCLVMSNRPKLMRPETARPCVDMSIRPNVVYIHCPF